MTDEHQSLVTFGSDIELKSLGNGIWELKGALVLFGDDAERDFDDDFFSADETDYDLDETGQGESSVYFNHGMDAVIGKTRLGEGKAKLTKDQRAVWLKHRLNEAKEYDAMVLELIKRRKAESGKNWGLSSGVPGHLVEREHTNKGRKIKNWPLGKDASITLIPNDWRHTLLDVNQIERTNVKSLLQPEAQTPEASPEAVGAANAEAQPQTETIKMEVHVMGEQNGQQDGNPPADNAMKAELDALKKQQDGYEQKFIESHQKMDKILKYMEDSPMVRQGGYFTVDGGAADPQIKSVGDLLISVARGDMKRLKDIYEVKLQSTASGAEGGYLIPETTLQGLGLDISLLSGLTSLVRRLPVPTPSGRAPVRNYRVTPSGGSTASASGIASQKRAEGAAYTEETMLLDEIYYDTTDFASGVCKATREQMRAARMIESLLRTAIEEDVSNREERAILRGTGAGEPLGILNWDGKVLVEEDTDNVFVAADSDEMVAHFLAKGNTKAMWTYHNSIYTSISPFVRENTTVQGNRGQAISTVFHGYPHMATQHLPLIGTNGYIVLGDWDKYVIFEFEGLYIFFSEHRYADEGKVAWFFGKNIDGKPIMPDAVILADGTWELSPFVVIKNKT